MARPPKYQAYYAHFSGPGCYDINCDGVLFATLYSPTGGMHQPTLETARKICAWLNSSEKGMGHGSD